MQKRIIDKNEAGQRLDKYLKRFLTEAPSSFLYKMLRKKNITKNGKKATGEELLLPGDEICFFLSDETIEKFRGEADSETRKKQLFFFAEAETKLSILTDRILYEDEQVLILNKPRGVLSQKALPTDLSVNEWLCGYLLKQGELNGERPGAFRPTVSNRLDRNTSGILFCAKTLAAERELTFLLRSRNVKKFYELPVVGKIEKEGQIEGFLKKDPAENMVFFSERDTEGAKYSKTLYRPLLTGDMVSLVEAQLLTGRSHQLRVHFRQIGHPIVGDRKYGNRAVNEKYRRLYGITDQMLHCSRTEFPVMESGSVLAGLSGKIISCSSPEIYRKIAE